MVVANSQDGLLYRVWSNSVFSLRRWLREERGFILSTESVLFGTLVVLGLTVAIAEVRNAVVQELGDFSQAIAWLSQDFEFTSVTSSNVASMASAGSQFSDSDDDQLFSSASANGILVVEPSVLDDE